MKSNIIQSSKKVSASKKDNAKKKESETNANYTTETTQRILNLHLKPKCGTNKASQEEIRTRKKNVMKKLIPS